MTTQTAKLTAKQIRLLLAIARFWDEHGYPPSFRDLMRLADISSTSVVGYNLEALHKRKLISYERFITRSVRLTGAGIARTPA